LNHLKSRAARFESLAATRQGPSLLVKNLFREWNIYRVRYHTQTSLKLSRRKVDKSKHNFGVPGLSLKADSGAMKREWERLSCTLPWTGRFVFGWLSSLPNRL